MIMKKIFSIILFLYLGCVLFAGCSGEDVSKSGEESTTKEREEVDVDLTALSSTLVYAEVYNIMTQPKDYLGKTIKMSGVYSSSYYDKTNAYYHFVIIEDVAACCQQGLEFIWKGSHAYPDDYPEDKASIEVIGVFEEYEEFDEIYYYLAVDDIVVSK